MNERDAWTKFVSTRKDVTVAVYVGKSNKYNAQAVVIDGYRFDSQREAARYQQLCLLERGGVITHLEIHPGFVLQVVALHKDGPPWEIYNIGTYHADFRYTDVKKGTVVIEDVKTAVTRTTAYKLRKRIVEAVHGVTITEVE